MSICFCATHCPRSTYHQKACCEKTTCACWCHPKHAIDTILLSVALGQTTVDGLKQRLADAMAAVRVIAEGAYRDHLLEEIDAITSAINLIAARRSRLERHRNN